MNRLYRILCIGALLGVPAFCNLVSNGEFRPGPGTNFTTVYAPDSTTIPGWTVSSGSVDWIGTYWAGPNNNGYSVDMSGAVGGAGVISTDISTIVGKSYLLTFWLNGNPDGGPDPKTVDVSAASASGVFTAPRSAVAAGDPAFATGYSEKFLPFTASGTTTTITFTSADNSGYGAALGEVAVTPEPGFYGLLALGLSGFVFAISRRTRRA